MKERDASTFFLALIGPSQLELCSINKRSYIRFLSAEQELEA